MIDRLGAVLYIKKVITRNDGIGKVVVHECNSINLIYYENKKISNNKVYILLVVVYEF